MIRGVRSDDPTVKPWQLRAPPVAALTASLGTPLCCALPSLLVFAGLGATVASLVASLPWLATLSHHKAWVFLAAGLLIGASWWSLQRLAPRITFAGAACPPGVARFARRVWALSLLVYVTGLAVAYGLGPLLAALAP